MGQKITPSVRLRLVSARYICGIFFISLSAIPSSSTMLGFWEKILIAAFASGPQPTHVGIILDGNRRWARKHGLTTLEGYDTGIAVMMKVSKLSGCQR
jgi:hypothetical protein